MVARRMPTKPDPPAKQRAEQEGPGAAEGEGKSCGLLAVLREEQGDGNDDDQRPDLAELGGQVGIGPFAHGGGDLLHLGRALVGPFHLLDQHPGIKQPGNGHHKNADQRGLLDGRVLLRIEQRLEEFRRWFHHGCCGGLHLTNRIRRRDRVPGHRPHCTGQKAGRRQGQEPRRHALGISPARLSAWPIEFSLFLHIKFLSIYNCVS